MEGFLSVVATIMEWVNEHLLANIPSLITTVKTIFGYLGTAFDWIKNLFTK